MERVDRANYVADSSWSDSRKAKALSEAYSDSPLYGPCSNGTSGSVDIMSWHVGASDMMQRSLPHIWFAICRSRGIKKFSHQITQYLVSMPMLRSTFFRICIQVPRCLM